jgi:hypothetical protein
MADTVVVQPPQKESSAIPFILVGVAGAVAGAFLYAMAMKKRHTSLLGFEPVLEERRHAKRLTAAQRRNLPRSAFALPDRDPPDLPLDKCSRVANAPARLSMMRHKHHVTKREYQQAARRILHASRRCGIHSQFEGRF